MEGRAAAWSTRRVGPGLVVRQEGRRRVGAARCGPSRRARLGALPSVLSWTLTRTHLSAGPPWGGWSCHPGRAASSRVQELLDALVAPAAGTPAYSLAGSSSANSGDHHLCPAYRTMALALGRTEGAWPMGPDGRHGPLLRISLQGQRFLCKHFAEALFTRVKKWKHVTCLLNKSWCTRTFKNLTVKNRSTQMWSQPSCCELWPPCVKGYGRLSTPLASRLPQLPATCMLKAPPREKMPYFLGQGLDSQRHLVTAQPLWGRGAPSGCTDTVRQAGGWAPGVASVMSCDGVRTAVLRS